MQCMHLSKLHQIFYACCLWPWFDPPMGITAICYMFPILQMTSCFSIMGPVMQAVQVGCKLKVTHQGAAQDCGEVLMCVIGLLRLQHCFLLTTATPSTCGLVGVRPSQTTPRVWLLALLMLGSLPPRSVPWGQHSTTAVVCCHIAIMLCSWFVGW